MESVFEAVDENNAFLVVDFLQANFDDFGIAGLNEAPRVLGFDGHFAMSAVNQDAQRDALGAAEVEQAVHGGTDGTTGVEDVIDEDQVHGINAERDVGGLQDGLGSNLRKVVAVQSDIEEAHGDFDAVDAAHGPGNALGERNTTAADTDESKIACAATLFHDLMGKALQSPIDLRGRH